MKKKSKKDLYIIGEIGINHNGSLKIAKKLIKHAKETGFNAVKFQTYKTEYLVEKSTPSAKYQLKQVKKKQFDWLKKYELSFEDFIKLKNYCKKLKIDFLSTPFDNESAIFLNKLKIPFFKISSGDLDNFHLLDTVKKFNKPIIISTGMSDFKKLDKTIKYLNLEKNKLIILHCISDYPTEIKDTYLGYIKEIKKFSYTYGISDHTKDEILSCIAVGLGCTFVEKHITLSRKMKGPDHGSSLERKNFKSFIDILRNIYISTNNKKRKLTKSEQSTKKFITRRLFFKKNIHKNDIIKYSDLLPLRSNNYKIMEANSYKNLIGKKIKKNIKKLSPIFK